MDNDTSDMKSLAEQVYQIAATLMQEEGHKPFVVAAVFTMIAMQIYKTLLNEEEYNAMVDTISSNRDKVMALDLSLKKNNLH